MHCCFIWLRSIWLLKKLEKVKENENFKYFHFPLFAIVEKQGKCYKKLSNSSDKSTIM